MSDAMMSMSTLYCYQPCPPPTAPLDRPGLNASSNPLQPNFNSNSQLRSPILHSLLQSAALYSNSDTVSEAIAAGPATLSLIFDSLRCHGVTQEGSPQGTISASAPSSSPD